MSKTSKFTMHGHVNIDTKMLSKAGGVIIYNIESVSWVPYFNQVTMYIYPWAFHRGEMSRMDMMSLLADCVLQVISHKTYV